jgi:hypothetical protein
VRKPEARPYRLGKIRVGPENSPNNVNGPSGNFWNSVVDRYFTLPNPKISDK